MILTNRELKKTSEAWHNGHRAPLQARRSCVRIPPGCKVLGIFSVQCLLLVTVGVCVCETNEGTIIRKPHLLLQSRLWRAEDIKMIPKCWRKWRFPDSKASNSFSISFGGLPPASYGDTLKTQCAADCIGHFVNYIVFRLWLLFKSPMNSMYVPILLSFVKMF
jgi:hypothetical protein